MQSVHHSQDLSYSQDLKFSVLAAINRYFHE